MAATTARTERDIDLSDLAFWARPPHEREAAFAALRAREHPQFFRELKLPFIRSGPGYYALVRHADVVAASRAPEVFSSEPCSNSIADMPGYLARYFGSMINMDDPRHARLRRIVSRAFTPRVLAKLEEDLRAEAVRIVDDVLAGGPGDFVTDVAARLPVRVICDMMGIPERDRPMVYDRTNIILGLGDPEYAGGIRFVRDGITRTGVLYGLTKVMTAGYELNHLAMKLARRRRRDPGDDLVSALVQANVDGEALTDQEIGSFFILLVVAGNETTRNAMTHGLKLLTDNPEQRALLMEDFEGRIGGAVEEIVRMATPVIQFRRTVTRDYELNGHRFRTGDKVLLFYNSANRDETVFEDPDVFDITRSPNPHVGFGGPGPHFCLGANLARREMTVMFRELFGRLPGIRAAGEPDRLYSNFINGIKHLPFTY
ncbi:methyl-branched lipid omega-hydroxylase [Actinomadura sp. NBRC 104425]|uniref:cytochrome P450 n=1 Tax=Actinomadura sp. NBRC 104425 TaxID=3032204 RepID=UPI0024A57772|nr:cytochrome P450 [Actinomadura sp. NBRC 104425]GLZ13249.1 methyl-branched lipid omega-hydroxylase [Actinomadura sp. NBRC 104425]